MKHTMTFERSTKSTHVFKGEEPITSIHIKQSAIKGDVPKSITIEIKEIK